MTETTVVTSNSPPAEDPSVLAEAAVASAALSGGALVRASDANETAEEANARAQAAQATADAALSQPAGVTEERARQISREELAAIVAQAAAAAPPPERVVDDRVEALPEQVLPKSARQGQGDGKKQTWAQRHGLVS